MTWSETWPTEPGWYWAVGKYRSGQRIKLETVRVQKISNGVAYVSHGNFLYPGEWIGVFTPLTPPAQQPTEDFIRALEARTPR